jgi:AcrR family transcriptional regulator
LKIDRNHGIDIKKPVSDLPEKQKIKLYPVVLKLFSTRDFHQVSIREISRLSGISSTTLYRYFPSKEKMLFSILDEKLSELAGLITIHLQGLESTKEMFRKLFWVTLNHYDSVPGMAVANIVTAPIHAWMEEETYHHKDAYELINHIIAHGRKRNELDPAIDNTQIIDLYFMHCQRQIQRWCYRRKDTKLADSVGQFFDIFWKTVSATSSE